MEGPDGILYTIQTVQFRLGRLFGEKLGAAVISFLNAVKLDGLMANLNDN